MKRLLRILMGILAGYIFLIKPRFRRRGQVKKFLKWNYAHRGLHDKNSPENTLSALKKAVDKGYGIEMDVRTSKDGLVIHHDDDLQRSQGTSQLVDSLETQFLKSRPVFDSQESIPSLSEALGIIDGKTPILLEIKSEKDHFNNARRVQELMDGYQGDYLIESFHPMVLLWYRLNKPWVLRGQLSGIELGQGLLLDFALKHLLFNFLTRPDFIAYEKVGGFSPWLLHKFRTPTFAYTIVDPKEKKAYFDAIIFEGFLPYAVLLPKPLRE